MRFPALVFVCVTSFLLSNIAAEAFCFSGVSRVIKVGPGAGMNQTTGQFEPLSVLRPKEVVLTFDDGPLVTRTNRILDILDAHCVKATFFVVGSMARAAPELAKRIRLDGHTVAVHSHTHSNLQDIGRFEAVRDIRWGYGAIEAALDGVPAAPFFRFPYLAQTSGLQGYLANKGVTVFGENMLVMSDDWLEVSADDVLNRTMSRLRAYGRGVILMHDIQLKTVHALPRMLAAMKQQGFKIVHILPQDSVTETMALAAPPRVPRPKVEEVATLSARQTDRDKLIRNFVTNVR